VATGAGAALPKALTVVVVAGTQVRLERLQQLLASQQVAIGGTARDGERAHELVIDERPDAVVVDLAPDAGGLAVIEMLMALAPVPIVLTGAAALHAAPGLAAGAVDVVSAGVEAQGQRVFAAELARHLRVASKVLVITHPRGRLRPSRPPAGPPREPAAERPARQVPLVVIGASTGGPPALATLLGGLPADLPAAVVVVQHMADGFLSSLASWLNGVVPGSVRIAAGGERLAAGQVVLAPGRANLEIDSHSRVRLTPPRPGQLHVPEVDATFSSVARSRPRGSVGVLLTGMGRDGAAGLLAMRRGGALTIGQDEQTSAVWGMPGAARALDAVMVELPLADIAAEVTTAVHRLATGGRR
jgi:two-component system chemotaxis response regulator CheB